MLPRPTDWAFVVLAAHFILPPHLFQGLATSLCKGPTVSILGFAGPLVSVATTQLCQRIMRTASWGAGPGASGGRPRSRPKVSTPVA